MSRYNHKVTIRDRNAMREMRAKGLSLSQIEEAFPDFSNQTIHRHVRDVPLPEGWVRRYKPRLVKAATVARLIESGMTKKDVSIRLGVSWHTVRNALVRHQRGEAA